VRCCGHPNPGLDWFLDHERRLAELVQAETGKAWNDATVEPLITADLINYFTRHAAGFLVPRKVTRTARPSSPSG
jgi:acyl-CoA reductase-like NAD-dependent aldehyde dehydrogenase